MATPTNLPASFVAGAILTAQQQNDLRGAFRVLQVKSMTYSTQTNKANDTFSGMGLSETITPQSNTNKILVIAHVNGMFKGSETANNSISLKMLRGATQIYLTENCLFTGTAIANRGTQTLVALDSPASTSSLTYSVEFSNPNNSSSVAVQFNGVTSSLYLFEISA
jgi:hypothetical protein